MTSPKPEPRVWILGVGHLFPPRVFNDEATLRKLCPEREVVHVVEMSAFLALKHHYEVLEKQLAKCKEQRDEWRRWFAWYPVYIDGTAYWLEYIERRLEAFEYRKVEP